MPLHSQAGHRNPRSPLGAHHPYTPSLPPPPFPDPPNPVKLTSHPRALSQLGAMELSPRPAAELNSTSQPCSLLTPDLGQQILGRGRGGGGTGTPEDKQFWGSRALAEEEGTCPGFPLTLFLALGSPLCFPSLDLSVLFCGMGRGNRVPGDGFLRKCPELCAGKRPGWPQGLCRQSSCTATSAPGLSAASGWAQSSGPVAERGGACSGSKSGPAQQWLGRGGHTSCKKTDPPRCSSGLGFAANSWVPATYLGLLSDAVSGQLKQPETHS